MSEDLADRLDLVGALADPRTRAAVASAAAEVGASVHLVGGAVRDLLLGRATHDADLVVEGDGVAFARALAAALGGRVVVHRAFGTAEVDVPEHVLDVATARRERYPEPGALPVVEASGLDDDLARRDFTVNAMAVRLAPGPLGELRDPLGGREDLAAGLLRVLHPASFADDPTRLVRAARYAARLDLRLEPATAELARAAAAAIWTVGGGRLADALELLASEGCAAAALGQLHELGVLEAIAPGLDGGVDTKVRIAKWDDLREHHAPDLPAWRGRLGLAARGLEPPDLDRLLALLSFATRDREAVRAVAMAHGPLPTRGSALAAQLERLPVDGVLAHGVDDPDAVIRYLDDLRKRRVMLDGDALQRELGIAPSPAIGAILAELRRRVLDDEITGTDEARRKQELAAARRLVGFLRA